MVERRGAPGVVGEQILQLGLKRGIVPRFEIGLLELLERRHQDLGNVTASVGSKMSAGVGGLGGWWLVTGGWRLIGGHALINSAVRLLRTLASCRGLSGPGIFLGASMRP